MSSTRTWNPILLTCVFLIALAVGLGINLLAGPQELTGDEPEYHSLALQVAQTGTYGTPGGQASRAPLYPFLLGAAYRVFGASPLTGRVLQSVLAAFMVLLTFMIACRFGGLWAGVLSAVLLMVDSYWWLMQYELLQENLLGVLLTGAVLAGLMAIEQRHVRAMLWASLAGLLVGLSLLTKPLIIPLLPLLLVVPLLAKPGERGRAMALVAICFAASVIAVVPWSVRNYRVFGRFVPICTGSGIVFHGAHCSQNVFRGGWTSKCELGPEELERLGSAVSAQQKEVLLDRLHLAAGIKEALRRPVWELLIHFVAKGLRFWSPSTFFGADTLPLVIAKVGLILLNCAVLASFLMAICTGKMHGWIAGLSVGAAMLTALVFWGAIRFRYPLAGVICAYAASYINAQAAKLCARKGASCPGHPRCRRTWPFRYHRGGR